MHYSSHGCFFDSQCIYLVHYLVYCLWAAVLDEEPCFSGSQSLCSCSFCFKLFIFTITNNYNDEFTLFSIKAHGLHYNLEHAFGQTSVAFFVSVSTKFFSFLAVFIFWPEKKKNI